MDPTIWMSIIAFSRVVVKWSVIFFNLLVFLAKLLKPQKMSDWNELSSIAGKWKFCRIYWQWILIEQTFLCMVAYRTFLFNPTNLEVPKKAPCTRFTSFYQSMRRLGKIWLSHEKRWCICCGVRFPLKCAKNGYVKSSRIYSEAFAMLQGRQESPQC